MNHSRLRNFYDLKDVNKKLLKYSLILILKFLLFGLWAMTYDPDKCVEHSTI